MDQDTSSHVCKVNKHIRLNHEVVYADEDHEVVLVVVPVDVGGERVNGHGGGTARELRTNNDVLTFCHSRFRLFVVRV